MSPREFLKRYRSLCLKSGFCLTSEDKYESLVLSRINPDSSNADEVLDSDWIEITLNDFSNV